MSYFIMVVCTMSRKSVTQTKFQKETWKNIKKAGKFEHFHNLMMISSSILNQEVILYSFPSFEILYHEDFPKIITIGNRKDGVCLHALSSQQATRCHFYPAWPKGSIICFDSDSLLVKHLVTIFRILDLFSGKEFNHCLSLTTIDYFNQIKY